MEWMRRKVSGMKLMLEALDGRELSSEEMELASDALMFVATLRRTASRRLGISKAY